MLEIDFFLKKRSRKRKEPEIPKSFLESFIVYTFSKLQTKKICYVGVNTAKQPQNKILTTANEVEPMTQSQ